MKKYKLIAVHGKDVETFCNQYSQEGWDLFTITSSVMKEYDYDLLFERSFDIQTDLTKEEQIELHQKIVEYLKSNKKN